MRFHWFLPSPRTADRDENAVRPGLFRRVLRRIGPTWAASPVRRLVQTLSFLAFLGLFLYVAWPYTARPARAWNDWLPVEVDAETGNVRLTADQAPPEPVPQGRVVHVVDPSSGEDGNLGSFTVVESGAQELELAPVEPPSADRLDRLSASFGPWSLFEKDPRAWPSHYADALQAKERVAAELFLALDPLVSISTALAARCWVWPLAAAGAILLVCVFIPRGFCAYVCPLGTVIDLFDRAVGKRLARRRVGACGAWVHVKYSLLGATMAAALVGVVISGFVAAIPTVTRAAAFLLSPLQTGLARDWHQLPAFGPGHAVSVGLFALILGLGFLRPRFWCKYVCPSGAVFSLGTALRVTERKVESTCTRCGRCVRICPFDAIKPDFTTRTADCTFCQTCGGVCPTRSIKFVGRWDREDLKAEGDPPTGAVAGAAVHGDCPDFRGEGRENGTVPLPSRIFRPETGREMCQSPARRPNLESPLGRRGFLATAVGLTAGAAGGAGLALGTGIWRGRAEGLAAHPIVRPPGSMPERQFLELCVRCGECFQACPNNVLQPVGFSEGWEALWTPEVVADWSGCEPSCANCGPVCPTGAIRALPLEEKRACRMGLAVVNTQTCLPHAGREDCRLCVDECATAGYQAIEFVRAGTELDEFGQPIEGTGFLAPVVLADRCVGCGLCQTRCHAINVKAKHLLDESAVQVEAGEGKEDRLATGSYVALRKEEQRQRELRQRSLLNNRGAEDGYLPGFLRK